MKTSKGFYSKNGHFVSTEENKVNPSNASAYIAGAALLAYSLFITTVIVMACTYGV